MATARWRGALLAESDEVIVVEGNLHFPPESVRKEFLHESETHTRCPWKGIATYFDIVVGDDVNPDGAWTYPAPTEAAEFIKNHIAFWRGVVVEP